MSSLIDLAVDLDNQDSNPNQKVCRRSSKQFTSSKIKKFMYDFVCRLSKSNKNHEYPSHQNYNTFQSCIELPPFHSIYSFLSKLSYKAQQKCFQLQNLLLTQNKPFTIETKSLRLAGIYLLNDVNCWLPGLKVTINMNNGLILITNCLIVQEQIVNKYQIAHSVIICMIQSIIKNSQKFVTIFSKISNNFIINHHAAYTQQSINQLKKTRNNIFKYLSICFLQLDISQVEFQRRKILSNPQLAQRKRFSNNIPLDIGLFEIGKILNLFQVCQYSVNKIQDTTIGQQQIVDLSIYLRSPKAKINHQNDNQFIFNQIYIKNPDSINTINLNMKGGTAQFMLTKVQFNYITASMFTKQQKIIMKQPLFQYFIQKLLLIKNPINKSTQKYILHEQKIINLLRYTGSAYMIKYYKTEQKGVLKNKLLMDYNPHAIDLSIYFEKNKNVMSIFTKIALLSNIANGLRFLNSHRIVHMDLAPKNILVSNGLLTKIIDFGQAYCDVVCKNNYTPGFTNPYSPPQVLSQKIFTTKQDSFSFGMILFKTLFNHHPYEPTQALKQSYGDKTYNNKILLAIQSINYIWQQEPMLLLLSLFIRCKSVDPLNRPYPTWIRIILKMILGCYRNIFPKIGN